MNASLVQTLVDYNYWAHKLVWNESVMTLSDEQFGQGLDYSWGSVKAQIIHTMSAEYIWLSRLKGHSPQSMLNPADFPDRAAIRARWDEIETGFRAYVAALDDDKLAGRFAYQTTSGKHYQQHVGEILMHIYNHGTDHRAQTLAMLHQLGAPTVEQDLIFYLRERAEQSV